MIDHRKLVALTTEEGPFVKFITSTDGYQVTDTVTSYTKSVHLVGYVPPDPIVVADGQGANWVGTNVYEVGQTVEGKTAAYTGGVEPVTYRYRFQFKATGAADWVNESWTTTTNAKNSVTYTLTETGQVKLQSQARDSSDPTVQLNSVTGIKTVGEAPEALSTEIGNLTRFIDGNEYNDQPIETSNNTTHTLAVDHDGDASPTFNWTFKQGSGQLTPFGNGSCTAIIETLPPGSCQIQCDIIDNSATDSPKSFRYVFIVID